MKQLLLLSITLTATLNLLAASTWTGAAGDTLWSTPGNWLDAAPASDSATDVTLTGAGGNSTVDGANPFLLKTLTFDAAAGEFALTGNPLTLYGSLSNLSSEQQTIANDITLAAPATWNINGNIHFTGNIDTGGNILTKTGRGDIILTGNNALKFPTAATTSSGIATGGIAVASGTTTLTGEYMVPTRALGAHITVTNGATVRLGSKMNLLNTTSSIFVGGENTLFDGNSQAFQFGRTNDIVVTDGAVMTNFSLGYLNNGDSIINKYALEVRNNATFQIGKTDVQYLTNPTIICTNGATLEFSALNFTTSRNGRFYVGGRNADGHPSTFNVGTFEMVTYTSTNNQLIIDSGGEMNIATKFMMGRGQGTIGYDDSLIITNGGKVTASSAIGADNFAVGSTGAGNTLLWVGGKDLETGANSLLDCNSKALVIGRTGTCTNNMIVVDRDGIITRANIQVGRTVNNSPSASYSRLTIKNGGYVSGKVTVGNYAYNNEMQITGTGSLLDMGIENDFTLNGRTNGVIIENGGTLRCRVAQIGNYNHSLAERNTFTIRAGGLFFPTGVFGTAVNIGYSGVNNANTSYCTVYVTDPDTLWNNNACDITIGNVGGGNATTSNNVLHVANDSIVTNIRNLVIGSHAGKTGCTQIDNEVKLDGGYLYAETLTAYTNNGIAVVASSRLKPAEFTGKVILLGNTYIRPYLDPEVTALTGRYTILTAGSIDDQGVRLIPGTDFVKWKLIKTPTSIDIAFRYPETVFQLY